MPRKLRLSDAEMDLPVLSGRSPALAEVLGGGASPLPEILRIHIDAIETDPDQPRRLFHEDRLQELAADIAQHGIDQPLIVQRIDVERYRLIAGERRLRAARSASLPLVPVLVRNDLNREEVELLRLRENLQREDLSPIEEAQGLKRYKDSTGKTWKEIAGEFGWSEPSIHRKIRLLQAPPELQTLIDQGRLSPAHYMELQSQPSDEQVSFARRAIAEGLSSRELHEMVQRQGEVSSELSEEDAGVNPVIPKIHETLDEARPSALFEGRSEAGSANGGLHTISADSPRSHAEGANGGLHTLSADSPRSQDSHSPLSASSLTESGIKPGRGRYLSEMRIHVTPDLRRKLRHIAADAAEGAHTVLARVVLEWFALRWESGEPLPDDLLGLLKSPNVSSDDLKGEK